MKLKKQIHIKELLTISILFVLFIISQGVFLNRIKEKYLTTNFWDQFAGIEKVYETSQYMLKNPKGWIPDETVNTYAAARYVKGTSPILIAPDTPPLGRYLIGVSQIIFGNEHIIILVFYLLSFFFLFLIGRQVFKSTHLALLLLLGVGSETLITNQLVYSPLLDIIQLGFLLSSLYFFTKGLSQRKHTFWYFCLSMILVGCFAATKFFITGVVVIGAYVIPLIVRREWVKLRMFLFALPLTPAVLLGSYIQVLFGGYGVLPFLGIQKWVYLYHQSQLIFPFSVWPLLFFNQWHVWFGTVPILHDDQWTVMWPILTILTIGTVVGYVSGYFKKNGEVEPYLSWSVCYLLFLSLGQTTSRYFIILIPFLYIITIWGVQQMYKKTNRKIL